jgi:hypothetical protein
MLVKFKEPMSQAEVLEVYEVLEDRDTRVLVTLTNGLKNFAIKPTFVFAKSDMIEVQIEE